MTRWTEAFQVEGVRCVRDRQDPHTFHYLPGDPTPQRDPEGHPTLSLLIAGGLSMLQLTAEWRVDGATLERVRVRLPEMFPELGSPSGVLLAPAPIEVEEAQLVIVGGEGQVIGRSGTSRAPPYAALFNVTLSPAQSAEVQAALHGRRGALEVRYRGTLPGETPIAASADVAGWFEAGGGAAHVRVLGG